MTVYFYDNKIIIIISNKYCSLIDNIENITLEESIQCHPLTTKWLLKSYSLILLNDNFFYISTIFVTSEEKK